MKPEAEAPPAVHCARCGAPFVCGLRAGDSHCWCADLPPLAPVAGRDCLCRGCLEQEVAAEKVSGTFSAGKGS